MNRSHKPILVTLLLVAAAGLGLLVPFMLFGNASGHDFEFHLASWMDVVHQWHQRVLYPRWAELANWGYGEPRFIFYPPLSWILGAGLSLVFPWPMVPGAYYWIAMMLAGACMFRLAREWLPPSDAGFAALIYAVNPYHQLHIYWRSDFAELLASAVLPLVILYAFRAGGGDRGALPPLALVLAGVWLMNAPAAVVATYTVALVLTVTAVERRNMRGLWIGTAALALSFGIAAFYIVPAAYEQRWVNIGETLASGLRPSDNFLFTWTNDPEHTFFNFRVSKIAVAEMLVAAVTIFAARPLRRNRDAWWVLIAVLAASALLMLPISGVAWRFLPKLRFVQFPWRWLLMMNVTLAVFVAAAVSRCGRIWLWGGCAALVILCGVLLAQHAWWDSDGVEDLHQSILAQGHGYFGVDEYGTSGSDHYDLDQKAPRVSVLPAAAHAEVHIERWRANRKLLTVRAAQPVTLALRLLNFPAWRVTINGRAAQALSRENTSQMLISVPVGLSRVEVHFARTPDRLLGGVISIIALALWLGLAFAFARANTLSGATALHSATSQEGS